MKNKKIISVGFALLLVISSIFMVSACGGISMSLNTRGTYLIPDELIKTGPYKGEKLYITFGSGYVGNKVFVSTNNIIRASNGAGNLVIEGAWDLKTKQETDGDKEYYVIKIKFHDEADLSDLFIPEIFTSKNMISGRWANKTVSGKSCNILTVNETEYTFKNATSSKTESQKLFEDN